jgi:hypothetical protein
VHGSSDKTSKIEATTAEAEALSKGLQVFFLTSSYVVLSPNLYLISHFYCALTMQTIKNDDLEEIRELGSGTYGAVFHGKWRGCDVAIKRIKASCFTGRPSERERLVCLISLPVTSTLGFVPLYVCNHLGN